MVYYFPTLYTISRQKVMRYATCLCKIEQWLTHLSVLWHLCVLWRARSRELNWLWRAPCLHHGWIPELKWLWHSWSPEHSLFSMCTYCIAWSSLTTSSFLELHLLCPLAPALAPAPEPPAPTPEHKQQCSDAAILEINVFYLTLRIR